MADYSTAPSLHSESASTSNFAERLAQRQEAERSSQPFNRTLLEILSYFLDEPTLLSQNASQADLGPLLQNLSPEKKQVLQNKAGESFISQIGALAQDPNAELQAQGLLVMGINLVQDHRPEAAAILFAQLCHFLENSNQAWTQDLVSQAKAELAAIEGQGSAGRRFEFNLLNLSQSALDPGLIGGIVAGSLVGQTTRLIGLTRIFGPSGAFAIHTAWAAKSLATGMAFVAEVPTVLAMSKGIHALMGQKQSWSSADLGKETLDLGLNLLLFKAMHWAGSESFAKFHGFTTLPELQTSLHPLTRFSAGFFPHVTAFMGVFTAQKAEAFLGLKPQAPNGTVFVDALGASLALSVGSEIGAGVLGTKWFAQLRAVEASLDSSGNIPGASSLGLSEKLGKLAVLLFPRPWTPVLADGPAEELSQGAKPVYSVMQGGGDGSPASSQGGPVSTPSPNSTFVIRRFGLRLKTDLAKKWKVGEDDLAIEGIIRNFSNTQFSLDPQRMLANYYKLLSTSAPKVPDLIQDEFTQPKDLLEQATHVFADLTQRDPLRTVTGTLYDHHLLYGLEQTLLAGNDVAFDNLVELATRDRTLRGIETFLRKYEPEKNFSLQTSPMNLRQLNHRRWFDRMLALRIPRPVFIQVFDYLEATIPIPTLSPPTKPLKNGNYNFISFRSADGRSLDAPMSGDVALKSLERFVGIYGTDSQEFDLLVSALNKAHGSPVPYLAMDRIFKVLATDNIIEKIREIANWEEFDWRKLRQLLSLAREKNDYKDGASRINGTVYTGYVLDLPYAEQLAYLYDEVDSFLRPGDLARHRNMIRHRASELLKPHEVELKKSGARPESATLSADDVPEMLYHGMTTLALQTRKAILDGEVQLLVLPRNGELKVENAANAIEDAETPEAKLQTLGSLGVEGIWKFMEHPDQGKGAPNAFFVPAHKNPAGKPLIVLTEIDRNLSRESKTYSGVFLAANAVHEYKHYLDYKELDFSNRDDLLKTELRAHGGYHYFLLQQGVPGPWERMNYLTGQGFGMWQRSLLDWDYLNQP